PGGTTDLSPYGALLHPPVTDARLRACFGHIRGATNPRVGALIRTCSSEAARAQPFTGLRLSGLMLTIVAEILRGQAGEAQLRHEHLPLLEEAERYMAAHCHEDLRVSELADLAGLSPSHFRLLFAQHVGRSPREHLRHLRTERARQLLIGSDLSLTTVAHRCGFATVHSFSRAFRAVEGLAPSDWRRYGTVTTRVEGRTTPYPGA
ncbi:MAG: helix-turn-helix domain-containing protein, partial [Planctomycetota bacterium]